MSTHGVFVLKDGDYVWGFHLLADGYNIISFYEKVKHLSDTQKIFKYALQFFAEEGYDDRSYLNFYHTKYNSERDYSKVTHYTLYFDGTKFYHNFE